MNCKVAGILIFTAACGIVFADATRRIHCKIFPYAPMCRGIAARSLPVPTDVGFKKAVKSLVATLNEWAKEETTFMSKHEQLARVMLKEKLFQVIREYAGNDANEFFSSPSQDYGSEF